jgi:hypothetical protein
VILDDMTLTYHGDQWLTRDNGGRLVYGGSELTCVRGGWEALEALDLPDSVRTSIRQARAYDAATAAEYGVVASRRNYDVGQGLDAQGKAHSGVFEASWRVGGASPAEIAAFNVCRRSPEIHRVRVITVEAYGSDVAPPAEAIVHFQGIDRIAGPLVRYTAVQETSR